MTETTLPKTTQPSAPLSPQARSLTLIGIILALLLGALDQTIVATAGPAIQKDLQIQPSLYAWLTIAYLVSSTVVVPIYGKLGDLYGRKPIILFGLVLFLIGSLLCGLAWNALTLILFRAFQGLGAGALFTTAFAIVADLYPPAERGRINGAMGGVFGLSSVLGPLVGGAITDSFSWHWVFFVNLPLGVLALAFIAARMPWIRNATAQGRVDYAGAVWLAVAVVPLLVALSLGKTNPQPGETAFAWGSWQIISMLAVFVVGLVSFIATERRAEDPLLDLSLFDNRTFLVGNMAIFVLGAGFLSAIVFLPLFMVNVVGLSATRSGLTTTPLTFGLIASAIISGALTTRFGRYKPVMLMSLVVLVAGFLVMGFTLSPTSTQFEVTLKMIVVGLGLGAVVSLYSLAVQNAVPADRTGVATSSVSFFQQLGGTVGLAILGTVFASSLTGGIETRMNEAVSSLPPAMRAQFAPGQGQSQSSSGSFNATAIKATIEKRFADQETALGRALRDGDADAARTLLGNPQTAPQLKTLLEATVAGQAPEKAREAALNGALKGLEGAKSASLEGVNKIDLAFKQAFTDAIGGIYRIGMLIILLGFAVTALLPELPLRKAEAFEAAPGFA
jgi:EmrB/QacA subfamily drug resistance transporter